MHGASVVLSPSARSASPDHRESKTCSVQHLSRKRLKKDKRQTAQQSRCDYTYSVRGCPALRRIRYMHMHMPHAHAHMHMYTFQ